VKERNKIRHEFGRIRDVVGTCYDQYHQNSVQVVPGATGSVGAPVPGIAAGGLGDAGGTGAGVPGPPLHGPPQAPGAEIQVTSTLMMHGPTIGGDCGGQAVPGAG